MLFKSPVFSQASGSIAGITYSHNRGGLYIRARATPTNPNSAAQQTVRAVFADLAQRWSQILTQANRDLWSNYAANTPVTNRLGDPILLSGQQMFIRNNSVLKQASLPTVDAGPTINGNAALSLITLTSAGGNFTISYDNTDAWAIIDDGALVMQTSRNLSPSINFFDSPFRFWDAVLGNTATPPTSPFVDTENAFGEPIVTGQKVFTRVRAVLPDGRISAVQKQSVIE